RDPRLHLAGARAREEGEREPLEMPEDRGAQVVHHLLPDDVREPGLADAEHAGDDRDRDHPADEKGEEAGIPLRYRLVEHLAQKKRREDPEDRRDRDQDEDAAELEPIRTEQPGDSPEVRATDRAIRR